jgi:uncharacterized radical SAM superfamily Fe-S cluster-containing enzyme
MMRISTFAFYFLIKGINHFIYHYNINIVRKEVERENNNKQI